MTNMVDELSFDEETNKNLQEWLEGDYDHETKEIIRQMLKDNPSEIIDSFYKRLAFGTGGLRALMGVGTNRLNQYTVRAATQGLANYILSHPSKNERHRVIIGYDSRRNSRQFAEEAAKVLAGNDIEVFIFDELRPTPLVSFGCRYKDCTAAIVVTASHNPPEYNGYKVYWSDGAQVLPPHDQGIIDAFYKITKQSMVKIAEDMGHPLITMTNGEIQEAYYEAKQKQQHFPDANRKNGDQLKIVYSNLHGTGITLIPEVLERWGFKNLVLVKEQSDPDGGFPTVNYPNPEEAAALELGIKKLLSVDGDILLATDPDADRVGVAVKHHGEVELLKGNQIACLCLEHICNALKSQGKLTQQAAFIKTVVTTELFREIAESYNRPCFDVLTGFKYIAELIDHWSRDNNGHMFIFGGEESYGYLLGDDTRDKDAVSSCALISEVALHGKLRGKTLVDLLHELYEKYGVYIEDLRSVKFEESREGHQRMKAGIQKLQENPPEMIAGIRIEQTDDYQQSLRTNHLNGEKSAIKLPKSNLLVFVLSDGSRVMVRPSGTEPKIKIYCGVTKKAVGASVADTILVCEAHCAVLIEEMVSLLN